MILLLENLSPNNFSKAINFLLLHEKFCLSLWNLFYIHEKITFPTNPENFFLITDEKTKKIEALIFKKPKGSIFHCFSFAEKKNIQEITSELKIALKKILQKIFINANCYSVSGSELGTKLILSIIKSTPIEVNDYHLLEHKKTTLPCKIVLPNNFSLQTCTTNDAKRLYQLQKMYEIIEVLPRGKTHNKILCILSLERNLAKYPTYGICVKNHFIAKAGVNAISPHCGQIGGVFTHSQYRSKGFAKFLVSQINNLLYNKKKSAVLFVRKTNAPAIKAYSDIGFYKIGNYTIAYF
ncbi:MAG: GNAT family N-acetyltransferase [Treponemataceae bacterium]